MNATWSLAQKRKKTNWLQKNKKKLQKNYKNLLQIPIQRVTIWLQKGCDAFLVHEIFFFLFLKEVPGAGRFLLRLFSFTADSPRTAQAVSRFVCKKAHPETGMSFFASKCSHLAEIPKIKCDFAAISLYKMSVFLWLNFIKFVLYLADICDMI